MYEFIDVNQKVGSRLAPADDLRVNGRPLSDVVPGYRQLSVSGRGMVGRKLDVTEVPRRDGALLNYQTAEPRVLSIQFELTAPSSAELRERLVALDEQLSAERLQVSFADEPDWTYEAVLSGAPAIEEDGLHLMSTFELYCADPYAYQSVQKSSGRITLDYAQRVLPERISFEVSRQTERITIRAGDNELRLIGSYSSGQTITLSFETDRVDIYKDTTKILTDLARFSYPEEFYIEDGDLVTATDSQNLEVEWRDRRL